MRPTSNLYYIYIQIRWGIRNNKEIPQTPTESAVVVQTPAESAVVVPTPVESAVVAPTPVESAVVVPTPAQLPVVVLTPSQLPVSEEAEDAPEHEEGSETDERDDSVELSGAAAIPDPVVVDDSPPASGKLADLGSFIQEDKRQCVCSLCN